MAWLLLLVVFWKPVYFLIRSLTSKFATKDGNSQLWLGKAKDWLKMLWELVKP